MPTGTAADEDHAPLPFLPTLLARWGVSLANEPAVNVGDAPSKTNDAPPKADAPAEVDDGKEGSALFEVVAIPGKGHGYRALVDIQRGTRIIAESPLFEQGPGQPPLNSAVDRLTPAGRKSFFALTQNELRFGVIASARGIFATNAHPCHDYNLLHRGIFPTIARINHACDSNAVYRWNSTLHQLTVHAVRDITRGSEITVCYSFDGMLRVQRQRHLSELFGFACSCAKCSLQGEELRISDERMAAIGDVTSTVKDLVHTGPFAAEGTFLRTVAKADPRVFLSRLEERWRLLKQEFPPHGYVDGSECFLQAFVELCERAASKLLKLIAAGIAAGQAQKAKAGSSGGSVDALRLKARLYADAALHWAELSRGMTRDIKGEDSPAFLAWDLAFRDGVWDLDGGATFDFYSRWVKAGLGRQSYCHRELA
jgi:hypothetical protein